MNVHTKTTLKVKAKIKGETELESTQKNWETGSESSKFAVNQDMGSEYTRMQLVEVELQGRQLK